MKIHDIPRVCYLAKIYYGICVQYAIDGLSLPEYADRTDHEGLTGTIQKEIAERLRIELPSGTFTTSAYIKTGDKLEILYARVSYGISPNYDIFRRIYGWWYNFNNDEVLSVEDFREGYGPALGDHIHEKWLSFRRDLTRMIGYLGNDTGKGQTFINMVMRKVHLYESRTEQTAVS